MSQIYLKLPLAIILGNWFQMIFCLFFCCCFLFCFFFSFFFCCCFFFFFFFYLKFLSEELLVDKIQISRGFVQSCKKVVSLKFDMSWS